MQFRFPCLCLAMLLLTGLAWARPSKHLDQKNKFQASADLDGDGSSEKIALRLLKGQMLLLVGKARHEAPQPDFNLVRMDVTKLWDKTQVVRLLGEYDGGAGAELLFVYRKKNIHPLGEYGSLDLPGNGIVYESSWMGFWARKQRYSYDPKHAVLKATAQDLYPVGVEAQVKKGFAVTLSANSKQSRITLKVKSTVTVVAADLSKCKQKDFNACARYLVCSSSGLLGWADARTVERLLDGLPWAG